MSSLSWSQGFCAVTVTVWRITFLVVFLRLVVGKTRDSGLLAFPHSFALKSGYSGLASQAYKLFLVCLGGKSDDLGHTAH